MTTYPIRITFKRDPLQRRLVAVKPKVWEDDCRFCALHSTTDPMHPACAEQLKHRASSCAERNHIYRNIEDK